MKRKGVYDRLTHSTRKVARKIRHDIKHVPKQQALGVAILFSIVATVTIGVLIFAEISQFTGISGQTKPSDDEIARACNIKEDCVAASCCHSFRCVNEKYAPSCFGTACTENCEPGTMDCGQGHCACTNGLCEAYIANP